MAEDRAGKSELEAAWQEWRRLYNRRHHPMTRNEAFIAGEAFAAAWAVRWAVEQERARISRPVVERSDPLGDY